MNLKGILVSEISQIKRITAYHLHVESENAALIETVEWWLPVHGVGEGGEILVVEYKLPAIRIIKS